MTDRDALIERVKADIAECNSPWTYTPVRTDDLLALVSLASPSPAVERENLTDYSKTRIIDHRAPIEHELKTWAVPYRAIESGQKTFEFRKNDRDYRQGDTLWLRETNVGGDEYTGYELRRTITYLLQGGMFGVPLGYVVMSLATLPPPEDERVKGLVEALEPFAAEADRIHPDWADIRRRATLTTSKELTVGDFRRARSALASYRGGA